MVIERLHQAWQRRERYVAQLTADKTNAFRFLDADDDGIPGLVIECFDQVAVFQVHQGKWHHSEAELEIAAKWCADHLGIKQVYLKSFVSDRTSAVASAEVLSPKPFWGSAPCAEVVSILENGLVFGIRPYAGLSVGLFLDQRDNRRQMTADLNSEDTVLNLFSYTCGFSVYAASRGASTTSVDVSAKVLNWGKENFLANGISLEGHRFFSADARYFLRAALKRQENYSRIFLDPPSFARGKKGEPFSVKRDLGSLLKACAAVLSPKGTIFVSTNYAQWEQGDLEGEIKKALGSVQYLSVPPVPKDFRRSILYCWIRPLQQQK